MSEPPFRIDGKVTLSTVYRAKGNEAAVVIVVGADAAVLKTRTGRNKLFVAFTRTKGWLRVFGMSSKTFTQLSTEINTAVANSPQLRFEMPNMSQLNTIRVVSCTEAAWRFLGLSLAGWNVLISLALAAVAWVAARRP